MAAVNTRPLNSAAAADKSEQLPVFFDPHRLRIGGVLFLRRRFGHTARAQGRDLCRGLGGVSPASQTAPI